MEIAADLLTASKNLNIDLHSEVDMQTDTIGLYILTLVGVQESKHFCCSNLIKFQLILVEFAILLRLVGVMNLILILSHPFSIQGREPNSCDFIEKRKKINVFLYSDIYGSVSFRLGLMIKITKLYILISVWMTLTFIQGHSCMNNQKILCPFSQKLGSQF